ncbi:MAG: glycosyltransferase [Myxococcota bacterium]|nr:glycosyltransferase [Myxococcota bacterium]
MSIESMLIAVASGLLLTLLYLHLRLGRSLTRKALPSKPDHYPSISVIRPIKGLDAGAEDNIHAALHNGYPGENETIFVFDNRSEPALPLVEQAIDTLKRQSSADNFRVIFSGQPPEGRTGKLNAMIAGMRHAKGELIVFADSDIRPDTKALTRLVETLLSSPGAGSAFAPVVVEEKPRTTGDAGYALLLNALYGPEAATESNANRGELPFIMGQFMVLTREAISAIGGLECAAGQLVDDMYLGAKVKEAGFRNMVSPHPVPIVQYGISLGEFWGTYVRWLTFSRSGLPGTSFKLRPYIRGLVFWLGLVEAIVAVSQGLWLAAGLSALAPIGVNMSNNRLHRKIGGARLSLRHRWISFGLLSLAPAVLLRIFSKREITWRGRSYQLNRASRLAAEPDNNTPPPVAETLDRAKGHESSRVA